MGNKLEKNAALLGLGAFLLEAVKHRIVADDKPVGFDHTAGGVDDGGRKA